ncbi:protein disulfide-isomerase [Acidocella aminolytica]|uniref:Thioredoxin peroxidase n=1 Tax=Acidocella aminolytica 101 = DSM 11237 TaxID=1120923 RepID=A0A0D6PE68_9PROT|nr:protein disulfide-isomerase [Acidocella aminolytica]GAN79503.1 thioredoxin peroxidase [Acidocella aminolytica 101 = DSM 11237]GBQ44315.1 putative protein-disulfide isomerase [Acidocella aminolytica 101 = DSM 11237]SHE47407.1 putative protein-disulfide isomerase [Acidocella aminolytica 101 = DSM 11237]
MSNLELRYYFDPLCGWCYASAEALAALAERHGGQLCMMPVGLFHEPRPVAAIADYAWRNDQRISQLTGQPFTEEYHRNVLQAPDGVFTSEALTLALVALGEIDRALEPRFLNIAQIARYVKGRDTSRVEEVVQVAETVATAAGFAFDKAAFGDMLRNDKALAARMKDRIAAATAELPGGGVPQLLVQVGGKTHGVSGQTLYAGRDAVLAAVEQLSCRP